MADIQLLLLAAGGSNRMGAPKQLLSWGDKTLIEHQIRTLKQTGNRVFVVLGANAELIIPVIEKFNTKVVINNDWENGMGSSIAAGIKVLMSENPSSDGAMISLSDQPLIAVRHYMELLAKFKPGRQQIIVSRSSSGWEGVPVLFDRFYFEELLGLKGDTGARHIIQSHEKNIIRVEGDEVLEDIDSQETYHKLMNKYIKNE